MSLTETPVCVSACVCVRVAGGVDGDQGGGMEGFTPCWYVLGSFDNGYFAENFSGVDKGVG